MRHALVLALALVAASAWATAPSITGSTVRIDSSADSSSQAVTVPSDAEIAIVMTGGYVTSTANSFTSLTINSVEFTVVANTPNTGDVMQSSIYYLLSPATGSQTFAWNWQYAPESGQTFFIWFLKDVADSSPIRDSDYTLGTSNPLTTPAITTDTNDLMVGVCVEYNQTNHSMSTAGQTEVNDSVEYNDTGTCTGYKAGSSGTTTMSCTAVNDGVIFGMSLKGSEAAPGGGQTLIVDGGEVGHPQILGGMVVR